MFERDFAPFAELLDDAFALNPNWKPLSPKGKALFFKAMEPFPFDTVSKAMTAHIRDPQRGKFQPSPSDLIAQINGAGTNDGRPGPEEAWSMLPHDEATSTAWTQEMQEAWGSALPLIQDGDKISARMTFKEVYARLVEVARSHNVPVKWQMSFGHDKSGHQIALIDAVRKQRLGVNAAVALLPPDQAEGLLRSLGVQAHPLLAAPSKDGQRRIAALKLQLSRKTAA